MGGLIMKFMDMGRCCVFLSVHIYYNSGFGGAPDTWWSWVVVSSRWVSVDRLRHLVICSLGDSGSDCFSG